MPGTNQNPIVWQIYQGRLMPMSIINMFCDRDEQIVQLENQVTRLTPSQSNVGRPVTTKELASFANTRRKQGIAWKLITKEWNERNPEDTKKTNHVRDAWRRHFGDKSRFNGV